MKVIYVMADSLRRDHVGAYGNPPWWEIRTPSLDRFARSAAVFDNAYICSFPTVPNRRDTHLGHGDKGLPFNRWKQLDPDEITFPKLLATKGVPSMLITDTQNNVNAGINLFKDYTSWYCNRGQEGDNCWLDDGVRLEYPVPRHLIRYRPEMWHRILVNRARRRVETDWFAPGTYRLAEEWLERNYTRRDFFLWIDTFDPHEPWDPPQYYIDMYDPGYRGRIFDAPTYGIRKEMGITDRELRQTRARYSGEVTMVDACFGRLIDTLARLGIYDETAIIFAADHGTCFDGPGDNGMIQKLSTVGSDGMAMSAGRPAREPRRFYPMSYNIARIPLMVKAPHARSGTRVPAFVQPWDITATILDLFGIDRPPGIIGRSVLPLVASAKGATKRPWHRGLVVFGDNVIAQATDGVWSLSLWRETRGPALFNLRDDPGCRRDLFARRPAEARRLTGAVLDFFAGQSIPEEHTGGYVLG